MRAFQQTDSRDAVQNPGKFAHFRYIRLTEKEGLCRIDPACEEVQRHLFDPFPERIRIGIDRQGVEVCNKEEGFVRLFLQFHGGADRPEIVTDMQDPGGLHAGQDPFFCCFLFHS